jgi:UDP-N-acetylglucosamine 2-epimerase
MIEKIKVITVVGTRPEIIRLSRVIPILDKYTNHILVHTGQNYDYELNQIFFNDLEIRKPDYFLEAAGKTPSETIGNTMIRIDPIFEQNKPEALLVLGDTNSCLSVIPAKRRQIPIFHMEAGNRCFDQRVPEETNRKIVDHIADINLTYSDIAREYLLNEGIPADRIIKTGSPMFEVLNYYQPKIDKSTILTDLKLEKKDYIVLSLHREENIEPEGSFHKFIDAVNKVSEVYGKRIIVSTHPRTRKRISKSKIKLSSSVELMKPLGFFDYIKLQENAMIVLSDSGTINEESSILNFPALNLREAHERPEGMEEARVIMTGLEKKRIIQGIEMTINQEKDQYQNFRQVSDYTMPNVSAKIIKIILSYTDYVNRVVWRK